MFGKGGRISWCLFLTRHLDWFVEWSIQYSPLTISRREDKRDDSAEIFFPVKIIFVAESVIPCFYLQNNFSAFFFNSVIEIHILFAPDSKQKLYRL